MPADYGPHPVTIKIQSLTYPALVLPVSFTFNMIVLCSVAEFSISTVANDFSYILNSGAVTKGPLTAVMIPNCKWPISYAVTLY